jgi:hypothetical protein
MLGKRVKISISLFFIVKPELYLLIFFVALNCLLFSSGNGVRRGGFADF